MDVPRPEPIPAPARRVLHQAPGADRVGAGRNRRCRRCAAVPDPGKRKLPLRDRPMPKLRKKSDLPTKTCVVCKLPFTWRKKWEKDWAEVSHCSDRCRKAGKAGGRTAAEG